jgi:pyrroloquinoline quinone (PQQ) biosynthesis protein C
LASDAIVDVDGNLCRVETANTEFEVASPHAGLMRRLLSRATGAEVLADIASEMGIALEVAVRMLQPFAREGVILDVSAALDAPTPETFIEAFLAEARFFARPIFAGPFWRPIISGEATPSLVFGWGIEFSHFVDAANEYMAAGVAHCREGAEMREWFAHHYIEEADHAEIFYEGLVACGFDRQQLMRSPALPSTRGLINHLMELAIEGAVPYAAAFGVMQNSREASDRLAIDRFYGDLAYMYGFAAPMFEAFRRHALIDVSLGHEKTVFERISESWKLTQSDRPRAIEAARSVAEHFVLFFEGILDYYGRDGASLPRHPAQLMVVP